MASVLTRKGLVEMKWFKFVDPRLKNIQFDVNNEASKLTYIALSGLSLDHKLINQFRIRKILKNYIKTIS